MSVTLDEIAWAELFHAYGSALDTPQLLRQAASEDPQQAGQAVADLVGSIFHQGTVYPATVAAVPFLAGLAQHARHGRAEIVWTLGMLADPRHAYGHEAVAVKAAVAGQVTVCTALLEDGEAPIREAAAYAAAMAATAPEPLWRLWAVETDPQVQASLALALGLVDAGRATPALSQAVVSGSPQVRAAAAVALLRAGVAWPQGAIAALVDAIDDEAEVTYCWADGGDWCDELITASPMPVALELLEQMLRAGNPQTRRAAVWAAGERCRVSRSAPALLVPRIVPLLEDPEEDVRDEVLGLLRRAGSVAGRYADKLAEIANGYPRVAHETGFTVAFRAVETLQRLGDPRWVEPVCATVSAGVSVRGLLLGAKFTPEALQAIRQRLRMQPEMAKALTTVLAQWGADAADAVPELIAALPHAGLQVVQALRDIGVDAPEAVEHLRARVQESGELTFAVAIWRITGDARPALDAISAALTQDRSVWKPESASELGEALAPLVAQASTLLTGVAAATHPQRKRQTLAARVVATAIGPEAVLPTVRAVLAGGNTPAKEAADLIADLAPAHRDAVAELAPLLRERLTDRWSRVAAARALARLGVPIAELAEPLVRGITDYARWPGLAAILELRATQTVAALEELVAQEERLDATHLHDDIVWADELLQERLRAAIAELSRME